MHACMYIQVTLSHLRLKESTWIHKPCIKLYQRNTKNDEFKEINPISVKNLQFEVKFTIVIETNL